jgi:hypothetical protein
MKLLIYGFLAIAFIAILDRLKEICTFHKWFANSRFQKLREKHLKIFRWFRSWDIDERKHITIAGIKIPLHPICWDGYHHFKNMSFLILIIVHCVIMYLWTSVIWYSLIPLVADSLIISAMQWLILKIMVRSNSQKT